MSYNSPYDEPMTLDELNVTPAPIRIPLPPAPEQTRSRARSPFSGLRLSFNTPPRSQSPSESRIRMMQSVPST